MKISTRGRYAMRVMVNLAMNDKDLFIPLKQIANEEEIPFKYVETIMTDLSKNNLVIGKYGKNGGYKLAKDANQYSVGEILKITENELSLLDCLIYKEKACPRTQKCKTMPLWQSLNTLIIDYLNSISLMDLLSNNQEFNFGDGI